MKRKNYYKKRNHGRLKPKRPKEITLALSLFKPKMFQENLI